MRRESSLSTNMAPALLTYALPTLHLVCHLTTPGNSDIGELTPNTFELATASPAPVLPPGYVAYPDFGVAYKVHAESVSWYVANARCAQERAHLAATDSAAKIELVKSQPAGRDQWLHVGFLLSDSNDDIWYSVRSGLPVSNLPWASNEPSGSGHCVQIKSSTIGLGKYSCGQQYRFVCEIPYP